MRLTSHVEDSNDGGYLRFNHVVDGKVRSSDDGAAKDSILPREHDWVPLDPRDTLTEAFLKILRSFVFPRIIKIAGIAEIMLHRLQKLNGLTLHR